MSTFGTRDRNLLDIGVRIHRSAEDGVVGEPTLQVELNGIEVNITWWGRPPRGHRARWLRKSWRWYASRQYLTATLPGLWTEASWRDAWFNEVVTSMDYPKRINGRDR